MDQRRRGQGLQTIYERPATRFVAEFIGSPSTDIFSCERSGEGVRARAVRLAWRPEDAHLFDAKTELRIA